MTPHGLGNRWVRSIPLVLATTVWPTGAMGAQVQWQPTKPIVFIVMAGKGGGADKAVRFIARTMQDRRMVDVPLKPVNITGQSGGKAMAALKQRRGDDHAIMFTLNSFYTTPVRQPKLGIDISTFTPIARMAEDNFALWVHKDQTSIKSIDDFIGAVRDRASNGRQWVMGGTGTGSEDNLLTDFLNTAYGIKIAYKPFRGGGAVAKALVAKTIDSTVNNPSEQARFYKAGHTKPIVVFSPERLAAYIRTPTLRETGMNFHYLMQRSVVGAPAMSSAAVQFYQDLFRRFFRSPEWRAYRRRNSLRGPFLTGDELRSYWLKEREKHIRWQMAIDILQ